MLIKNQFLPLKKIKAQIEYPSIGI
uniref:Uncharacterized protein n=1 Tax=Arundo donax TaxID=35708 RepID=A0A0A8Y5Y6_ARUDO